MSDDWVHILRPHLSSCFGTRRSHGRHSRFVAELLRDPWGSFQSTLCEQSETENEKKGGVNEEDEELRRM